MQKIEKDSFFKLQEKFDKIVFTQSKGWYNYLNFKNNTIVFFVDNDKDPSLMFWGREQIIPVIKTKILRIDGEVYNQSISDKVITKCYNRLLEHNYIGIEINSCNTYNVNFEIGIRRSGFVRPLSLFSCPLTIEVDLLRPFNFDNNWKRNVKKANKYELNYKELKTFDAKSLSDIVSMFKEMAKLKGLKYSLDVASLKALTSSEDIRVFVALNNEGKALAARIIHDKNKYATDIYAANSVDARQYGAAYFLVEKILQNLKEEGKTSFDFGRIPPSNHNTDTLYNFKNATRGNRVQYNGEWNYYRNKTTEYLIFLFKNYILKSQRY
ncbi:MAG: peptidoglycan bridge formation glycyltransferase FemA/FemB family protein [Bacteroidota bacterium]|nr:peptidoglycan bridge formation glycyltransferase FemA/FemB family protein [Bacteroidota bacterium]